jgi:hypothetical protein
MQLCKNPTTNLVFVGDTINNCKIHLFVEKPDKRTDGTYRSLTEPEVLQLIVGFIKVLLEHPAKELGTLIFARKVFDLLKLSNIISEERFQQYLVKDGVPFKNCFVEVQKGNPLLVNVPYSRNVFVSRKLDSDYHPPKVKLGEGGEPSTLVLKDATLEFLQVICENNVSKLNVLRTFIRNTITSRIDGVNFQNSLWIFGPPATSKSTIVEILKKCVDPTEYCEFSREQNQFSAGQLVNIKIAIVSDLDSLNLEQKDILKRALGRDTITYENKHMNGTLTFKPKCQFIFVSNKAPAEFPLICSDRAFMDKVTLFGFSNDAQIPPELQIADLREQLDDYMPDIINWSLHLPKKNLDYFVRAVIYNEFYKISLGINDSEAGYKAYIKERFWYNPGEEANGIPLSEIVEDVLKRSKLTGDISLVSFPSVKGKQFDAIIIKDLIIATAKTYYNLEIVYKKSGAKYPDYNNERVWVLNHLEWKEPGKEPSNPYCQEIKEAQRFDISNLTLPDPFSTEGEGTVTWFKTSNTDLSLTQKEILRIREERELRRAAAMAINTHDAPNPTGVDEDEGEEEGYDKEIDEALG